MEYNNRIALVTGAANGIGRATSLMLARRGVDLVLFDISAERLREVEDEVKKLGRKVISVVCDMGEQSSIDAALEKIKDWKIDILVNNAALWRNDVGLFVKTNPESWKRRWMVNVWGLMYLTQKLLPPMLEQRWGRVINVSSVAGRYGIANMVDYSTTKGAVHSFTKALAKETSPYNVLVTSMSPGNVGNGELRQNELAYMGRESSYDEQAEMICFLASENASYCSGQDFQVDGCRRKM